MNQFCEHCNQNVKVSLDPVSQSRICSVCKKGLPYENRLLEGTVVAGFIIEKEIGRGGMGTVYKSLQINLERDIALKVLSDELSQDKDFVDRFFHEARAAASLSHPNIVQAYDAGATPDNIYYFAMELIDGETLELKVCQEGAFPQKLVLKYAIKIAQALEYAYKKQKLSHGDIKPENVILNSYGEVKLADLGLARKAHEDCDNETMATPLYAPPEIVTGDVTSVNVKSDMYSFGATMYHLLAGEPPFPGDDPHEVMDKQVNEAPIALKERNPEINIKLSDFVNVLLAKSPDERPESWHYIVKHLEKIAHSKHMVKLNESRPHIESETKGKSVNKSILVIALIGLFFVIVELFVIFNNDSLFGQKKEGGKEAIVNKWDEFKHQTVDMSTEERFSKISEFLEKNLDAPTDAYELMMTLKMEVEQIKKSRAQDENNKKLFLDKLVAQLKKLDQIDINTRNIQSLVKLDNEISKLQQEGCDAILANVFDSYKIELDQFSDDINGRINTLEAETRRIAQARAQAKADKLIAYKLKQRQIERQAILGRKAAIIKENKPIDELYLALSRFYNLSESRRGNHKLITIIEEWFNTVEKSVELIKIQSDFINGFSEYKSIKDLFIDNPYCLEGECLPDGVVAKGLNLFLVSSVSTKSIRLSKTLGKGNIGKIIKWSSIKGKKLSILIKDRIVKSNNFENLEYLDQKAVLIELLLARNFKTVKPIIKLLHDRKNRWMWSRIVKILEIAEVEANLILTLRKALQAEEMGDNVNAAKYFLKITESQYLDFYNRYKFVVDDSFKSLKKDSPDALCAEMLEKVDLYNKNNLSVKALCELATADFRYGQLSHISNDIKSDIRKKMGIIIAKMIRNSSRLGSFKRTPPFRNWETDSLNDLIVCFRQICMSKVFKANPKVMDMVSLVVDLTHGDYQKAIGYIKNDPCKFYDLLKVSGSLRRYVPSILFAGALAADRIDENAVVVRLLNILIQEKNKIRNPTLAFDYKYLAAELAMMIRVPERTIDIVNKVDYRNPRLKPTFANKLILIKLLATLQNPTTTSELFRAELNKFISHFQKWEFEADYKLCCFVVKLLKGNYVITKMDVNQIVKSKYAASDLCYRILLDALAFSNGKVQGKVDNLIQCLNSKVSNNLVSSELEQKLVIYQLIAGIKSGSPIKAINKILERHNISNLPLYPKLLLLKYAYCVKEKQSSVDVAISSYKAFSEGNINFSSMESDVSSLFRPDTSLNLISKMIRKNCHRTAFWAGVASFIALSENHINQSHQIMQSLKANSKNFTWQESLLIGLISE